MSDLVGNHIKTLKPYVPGKPIDEVKRELGLTDVIKLASNENPLGPSPKAMEAVRKAVEDLHIYPDGAAYNLREGLAKHFDVPMDEVILGNGSNELLTLSVRAFCQPGDTAVISEYAFIAYRVVLTAANVPITAVPMREGYVHDLDAMAAACDETTKIVFVANPNNPTGTYVGREKLEAFLRAVPERVIVVMDEAYIEYAMADDYVTAQALRNCRERLIITRTFSKCYGIAGLRVGYAIGPKELIDYMNRIREPFNANSLGQVGALAALSDDAFVKRTVESNEAGRKILEDGLAKLESRGISWLPSQTNFLLVKVPVEGPKIFDLMLRQGVIVRPMSGYGLHNFVRITIGTAEETRRCLSALSAALDQV